MSIVKIERIHFHTFDSLRFLSFLLVFLSHCIIPESNFLHSFSKAGKIGVSFFFVLSGFLITYILLLEKLNNQNRVRLKNFFLRRTLRIWPLYYAMVLFAMCTPFILSALKLPYSNEGYQPRWIFTMTFLENYVAMYKDMVPNVSPINVMWSLCVEEHFYIIWGLIFYFISIKNIPKLIVICILISFISRIIYEQRGIPSLDILSNIQYFAFGAVPAYIFVFHKEIIEKTEKISVLYKYTFAVFTLLFIFMITNFAIITDKKISSIILAILFSVMILSTLGKKNAFKISDNGIMAQLGKYTYGLYLIHAICVQLFNKIGAMYELHWFVVILSSFSSTVLLSYLSYHLFEKQFLKLKKA
ncbi:acyltransferase family protein [Chryseobacterium sp. FH1]|uniref:acyltransferase family protein n=1 Tax=Chryseobacterium sp. FH1 TaxID=1233951 RepID=UPI00068AF594|nr:acyltransferase [Chryseobacterium sp. FH1]